MKGFLAALTFALVAMFVAASCNDTNNTFQGFTGAALTFLSPADATAGGRDFTLTVNGAGFVAKTVVQWNGQNRPTTFVRSSQVTASITAADIAAAGKVFVNTLNPPRSSNDNGLSNSIAFVINPASNPVPTVTSISPTSAKAGSGDFTLTVAGTNFLAPAGGMGGSVVQWNAGAQQTSLTPSSVTSTQIQVTVPGTLIAAAGSATVTVFNPAPGGGTSPNGQTFTITPGPIAAHGAVPQGAAAEDSPAVSSEGRFVAYSGADGEHTQIFLRDTCEGANAGCQQRTILVSSAEDGSAGNGDSQSPALSAEGRYAAFSSAAANLVKDAPAGRQVFLRDTCLGAAAPCTPSTQLVSTDPKGALTGAENLLPSISTSGRFVAFLSVTPSRAADASGAAGSTRHSASPNSGFRQVFVRDTCLGAANCAPRTTRISLQPGDAPAAGQPGRPALSGDGGRVALAGRDATLLTRGRAIYDRVFLAATQDPRE